MSQIKSGISKQSVGFFHARFKRYKSEQKEFIYDRRVEKGSQSYQLITQF